jgi:hypothetical protein
MGRRLYSDDEIERLQLLQFGARAGRGIGEVASWLREDLLAICDSFSCLKPIRKLDLATLDPRCTTRAWPSACPCYSRKRLSPPLNTIGDECWQGTMPVGEEYMATAVICSFLGP